MNFEGANDGVFRRTRAVRITCLKHNVPRRTLKMFWSIRRKVDLKIIGVDSLRFPRRIVIVFPFAADFSIHKNFLVKIVNGAANAPHQRLASDRLLSRGLASIIGP